LRAHYRLEGLLGGGLIHLCIDRLGGSLILRLLLAYLMLEKLLLERLLSHLLGGHLASLHLLLGTGNTGPKSISESER
jgi:hypothetical protein